jgi:cell division protease FtsH
MATPPPSPPPERRRPQLIWAILMAFLAVQLVSGLLADAGREVVPYSRFRTWLDEGRVSELRVGETTIVGTLRAPRGDEPERFSTTRVPDELADRLSEQGVDYTGMVERQWSDSLFVWLLPLVLLVLFWGFMLRRMGGGLGGGLGAIGRSKAKITMDESTGVTFSDVAGVDEAKEELREVIGFLQDPQSHGRLGGRLPKGILLVGPPGTGKTLLARAVAGEAGVPFFSIGGSEFVELFVGVGAARVRDLFKDARAKAPCIIFIDELDALGRARGAGPVSGGHDEKEQTLNQLLSELDGFDPSTGVVLLSATNRPEVLDPALLRAGRFDRQILVDRPDKRGREAILVVHLAHVTLADDVDAVALAALTPGFTGADLANMVNEAALLATRRSADAVARVDFESALERIVAGLEKRNRLLNETERRIVAHHELGHALVARALPGTDEVHKVSIIPRGVGALGYTIQRPTEDRFLMSRAELLAKMAVLLGGRAAEELVFGEVSTGAADDLVRCTGIARAMVTRYGMDEELGLVSYDDERSTFLQGADALGAQARRDHSEQTGREIDLAVKALVEEAHARALGVLEANRQALAEGAARLLEQETLDGDELPEVVPA